MALVAIDPSTIYTGNQYSLSIAVAPNSTPLTDPSAIVRAAIVSPRLDANLSGAIDLTFDATTQEWQGIFTGAQTRQLLTNPDDLTSGLLYSKPKIEVEVVGTGYTRHYQVTASASLIHDGPIEPPPVGTTYITSDEFEQHTQLVGVEGHIPSEGLLQAEVIGLAGDLQEIRDSIAATAREFTFNDADLSVAGALPIIHNLNTYPRSPGIWTHENEEIQPDDVDYVSENAIVVYLQSYRPISGIWRIII